ncbi:MAG: hypothetical protein WCF18_18965 [Chthoniobacteraceae bacterium]
MNPQLARVLLVTFVCAWSVGGCQSPGANPRQERAAAGARVSRDGQLQATRPQHEFRGLRTRLPGKNMREVASLLGTPAHVVNMGDREWWDYKNVAYDSVTGRTVSSLSIWFTCRVADDVQASF